MTSGLCNRFTPYGSERSERTPSLTSATAYLNPAIAMAFAVILLFIARIPYLLFLRINYQDFMRRKTAKTGLVRA